jgi:O-acetyl-ADP-ribose deacetylase (regulator of RNase III)
MLNGKSKASLAGLAVLATLVAPGALSPAQADGVRTFNCVGTRGSVSCTSTYRRGITNPYIIAVPGPRTEQEIADSQRREKLWDARCKPDVRQDSFGVERYVYAARGCEFGKYQ